MEPVHVLNNSAVRCLTIPELPLDDQERVLHLAPNGRFSVFNLPFPVNSFVVLGYIQTRRFPVDPELDLGKVFVSLDFLSLFHPMYPESA